MSKREHFTARLVSRIIPLLLVAVLALSMAPVAYAESGESGSNTGTNIGGSVASPPSGTNHWIGVGVTMQVVTYPYKDCWNRENSWQCVVDSVQSYEANGEKTVLDGISITENTFLMDSHSGRVYKVPSVVNGQKALDLDTKIGMYVRLGSVSDSTSVTDSGARVIDALYWDTVSGPATDASGNSYTGKKGSIQNGSNVYLPEVNDVEKFLQRIILGNNFGEWDVHNVALDSSGNTLEGNLTATSADDVSVYAQVLRYLGCGEELINNYVKGYSGQLDKDADGDTLIPTIIWSYVAFESVGNGIADGGWSGDTNSYNKYTINDDGNLLDGKVFKGFHVAGYHIYTVGDVASYGNTDAQYASWWKGKTYSSPDENFAGITCHWDFSSTYACESMFGLVSGHQHKTYFTEPNYAKYMQGSGYINSINVDGVDETDGNQYYFRGYWTPYGDRATDWTPPVTEEYVELIKSCSDPDCWEQIKDNALYSLAGAQYTISVGGVVQETLVTDAAGKATSSKQYAVGTVLTIQETVAPPGFKLDTTVYTHTVVSGENTIAVKDEPVFDPPFAITKIDKDTTTPQGDGSFSGAVFKWEYYDNYTWSGTAKRTWYFQTNASGKVYYDPTYLASGYSSDALYAADENNFEIPLGSVKITEIKNSLGYIVMPQSICCTIVATDSTGNVNVVWTDESLALLTDFFNGNFGVEEPIDESLFGSFTLEKYDSVLGATAQGRGSLANAKFQVINNSANSVKIGDFAEAAPGEVCYEFTTDGNGRFESGSIFPLGSYTVREVEAPRGYLLNSTWSASFTVTTDTKDFAFTYANGTGVPEEVIRGGLRIVKQDAALGAQTGADAPLAGITFSVINNNANPVVVDGTAYAPGETVLTLAIAWSETYQAWVAETAADTLPYGAYIVRENPAKPDSAMANGYYLLNGQDTGVRISGTVTVTLTVTNELHPGQITIQKVNHQNESLPGAKFLLEWSEDGTTWTPVTYSDTLVKGGCGTTGLTDGCLVTDDTGMAVFENLYPGLQYRVKEVEAPEGYVLPADYAYTGELPEELDLTLTVINGRGYILPETGANSFPLMSMALAFCLSLGGVLLILLRQKRWEV